MKSAGTYKMIEIEQREKLKELLKEATIKHGPEKVEEMAIRVYNLAVCTDEIYGLFNKYKLSPIEGYILLMRMKKEIEKTNNTKEQFEDIQRQIEEENEN